MPIGPRRYQGESQGAPRGPLSHDASWPRARVEGMSEVGVAGEAAGAEEALRLVREHRPDLVILDTDLDEDFGGLRLCKGFT